MRKGTTSPNFTLCAEICLEGLNKTMKNLNQCSLSNTTINLCILSEIKTELQKFGKIIT